MFFKQNPKKIKSTPIPDPLSYSENDVTTIKMEKQYPYHQIVTACSSHIGTRDYQQDSLYVSETVCFQPEEQIKSFGILCDGMGGLKNGAEASKFVVQSLAHSFSELKDYGNMKSFIESEIRQVDKAMSEKFSENDTGTTLTAVIIINNILYWASVGDSSIYYLRQSKLTKLTRDHNYLMYLLEDVAKGNITAEEAARNPQKDALISYIGSGAADVIDISPEPIALQNGDVLLMCSDGLTKSLTDNQICDIIYKHYADLKEAARLLPIIAFDTGGSKDNTSVILMQYFE